MTRTWVLLVSGAVGKKNTRTDVRLSNLWGKPGFDVEFEEQSACERRSTRFDQSSRIQANDNANLAAAA